MQFVSPPSSIASSQPQHAAGPNYILGPICFLGGHLTAWMSQILCLLPVELPILPAYRNHHPSHRSTVSTGLMVREPSFEALDWGHVKARRDLPSALSSTADNVATPRAEECAHLFDVFGGGESNSGTPAPIAGIIPLCYCVRDSTSANPYFSVYTFSATYVTARQSPSNNTLQIP